ncbi:dTDP-4-dehydrorhamnose 3,5-epimerase [Lutibacter sp.]|uniref:dTDP-4-dehydrorhamnose 3,5-epimerase n=1 Tax=Lutibacter sp. TaxID=1925666 RepID=UPI002735FE43|nr:dTDP-4-dehydrorhamnose 3,5-epimerase [Lutibacter sp.]MDP3313303.1 dTDP-4-dehydrorhamnose 3,5-epimerase [Lutibacter sp.]
MKFKKTNIPDVILCEPKVILDERGYFFESFKMDIFEAFIGYKVNFLQDNEAKSSKGVLRGLHYQDELFSQAKLVRVVQGKVLDIAVDIRKFSPTFGKYIALELSGENKLQLFIPRGFAHGYLVLEDDTIFSYKVDNMYNNSSEKGIIYNDKSLNIDWNFPESEMIISEKDKILPSFLEATYSK